MFSTSRKTSGSILTTSLHSCGWHSRFLRSETSAFARQGSDLQRTAVMRGDTINDASTSCRRTFWTYTRAYVRQIRSVDARCTSGKPLCGYACAVCQVSGHGENRAARTFGLKDWCPVVRTASRWCVCRRQRRPRAIALAILSRRFF